MRRMRRRMGVKIRGFKDEEKERKEDKEVDEEKNNDEDDDEKVGQIRGMSNWGAGGGLFKRNTPRFHIFDFRSGQK